VRKADGDIPLCAQSEGRMSDVRGVQGSQLGISRVRDAVSVDRGSRNRVDLTARSTFASAGDWLHGHGSFLSGSLQPLRTVPRFRNKDRIGLPPFWLIRNVEIGKRLSGWPSLPNYIICGGTEWLWKRSKRAAWVVLIIPRKSPVGSHCPERVILGVARWIENEQLGSDRG
jgi:hypothetical protein